MARPVEVLVVVLVVVVPITLGILALLRAERRPRPEHRGGGNPFGVVDEIFAPTRHEAVVEMERQKHATAPAPTPGDPPWGRFEPGSDGRPCAVRVRRRGVAEGPAQSLSSPTARAAGDRSDPTHG